MADLREAVEDFLSGEKLAVAGVSREGNLPANVIFRKLKANGFEVYPVNPRAEEVEGVPCFADLTSVPAILHGVVIATPPHAAEELVRECAELGIQRVWMHRAFGAGSVSDSGVRLCREEGIAVIAGACPMMYLEPVDLGHRCFRWIFGGLGKLPAPEGFPPRT
jgi:predicted CoA-binding protein